MKTKFYAFRQVRNDLNDVKGIGKIVILECEQKQDAKTKLKELGCKWDDFDECYSLQYLKYKIEVLPDIASYFIHFYDGSVVKEYNF